MGSFMSQNVVSIAFFTNRCARNIFFNVMDCLFPQARSGKPILKSFINIFFTKACFFVWITHYSVKFIWFALLRSPKFDDRSLFRSGTLWFATILNCRKISRIYIYEKKICFFKFFKNLLNTLVCVYIYIYIYIYTHTHTHRGFHK